MIWQKEGLIFKVADYRNDWRDNSALQPTPLRYDEKVIRVFVGFRNKEGISRIGYIDLDSENPRNILSISENPVLDIGEDGTFDENGVVPSAVVKHNGVLYLYYAGYQLGQKIRFTVFGGLAMSFDNGKTFKRYKKVPVFERNDEDLFFRVPHSVLIENGVFKFWYGGGNSFRKGQSKSLPVYDIRYIESADGLHIGDKGRVLLTMRENEHRLGRPYLVRKKEKYLLFFGAGTEEVPYRLAYAESDDGVNWIRKDETMNLFFSEKAEEWDSKMMAYPSIINTGSKTFLFYNGNNYGYEGFGYAELIEE